MGRRVFLDVGGHLGETLTEVIKPRWAFDRIWTFEPVPACVDALRRIALADSRVVVVPAGRWHEDTELPVHDPGAVGASVLPGKAQTESVEMCAFIDASAWIARELRDDDVVWLKLNCEGAECDILDGLIDSRALRQVTHLVVHFDIRKVPGLGHRADEVGARLNQLGIKWRDARDIMFGRTRETKTANWLAWCEAGPLGRVYRGTVCRVSHRLRRRIWRLRRKS